MKALFLTAPDMAEALADMLLDATDVETRKRAHAALTKAGL